MVEVEVSCENCVCKPVCTKYCEIEKSINVLVIDIVSPMFIDDKSFSIDEKEKITSSISNKIFEIVAKNCKHFVSKQTETNSSNESVHENNDDDSDESTDTDTIKK